MKPRPKDQIQGRLHESNSRFKEDAGQVTNDPDFAAEGQHEKLGQIEKVFEK
jgi:uncharacterized protein YjbJ (UPF0337 family)